MSPSLAPRVPRALLSVLLALAALLPAAGVQAKKAPETSAKRAALLARPLMLRDIENGGALQKSGGAQSSIGTATGRLLRYWRMTPDRGGVSSTAPRAIAESYLTSNAARLGLVASKLGDDLSLFSEKASPSGTHVRYQQQVNGVPVYRGDLVIKVSNGGQISSVMNNLRPDVQIDTQPAFDAKRAIELGAAAIAPTGKAIGTYRADLEVFDLEGGARLGYRVSIPNEDPMGDWQVFVDAKDGKVLGIVDRAQYADGTGQVFDPDPRSKMSDSSFVDSGDADSAVPFPAAYDIVNLLGMTFSAGTYSLSGPYAQLIDNESPTVVPVTATHADSFRYQRSPSGFEDVMCYWQLDMSQRYIQSLGFTNVNNRVQGVDSHGLSGADNSHYVPSTGNLAFGEGGIDDDEDADVIWHEYGHSIQDNIVPGWGGGQEGAMGEGFGDYWAHSYSLFKAPGFQPLHVFTWDGNGETWPGRVAIDVTMHYPENCCGEVHDSGTLWCSGLIDAYNSVGRTAMDRIVLDHHFALGTSATMADAAAQIIQSDFDLYGGAHVSTLVAKFGFWGFVNPADFVPTITHTPRTDTEASGPYAIVATITSVQPLDPTSLKVHYGVGAFTNEVTMTPTANPNEYSASIPDLGSNVDIRYYIIASDNVGGTSTHPVNAPTAFHQFHVGPDVTAPVITHTAIGNFPQIQWPATVNVTVTDNLGVNADSVRVNWQKNGVSRGAFYLTRVGLTNNWTGAFPGVNADVSVGDVIDYRITARDVASTPNVATHPAVGFHTFNIIASRGTILVLDDDEVASHSAAKQLTGEEAKAASEAASAKPAGPQGLSATNIAAILNARGFTATVEAANTSNPATWSNYQLLVSSSGGNEGPVANAAYRTAIENWVAGGGKLLVEGGEVAYDAASTPGYPTFAANVLHTIDWDADNAGALTLLTPGHPIATTPYAIPSGLAINYTAFGSEDSYKPVAPAYIVYGVTAQAGNGGILVYDDTPSPQSAQIVVFGFDFKDLADATAAANLLDNTATYLLASEGAPTGAIAGQVLLSGTLNHAGTTVTLSPGGASTTTDALGNYSFGSLYPATYSASVTHAGYTSGGASGIVVTGVGTAIVPTIVLYPQVTYQYCASPALAIPDNNPTGVTSNQVVSDVFAVAGVEVDVNITHTYRGDLTVDLSNGVHTVRLHNRTGGSADNIVGTYPTTLTVNGPGALSDFLADGSAHTWSLKVVDAASIDVGTLNSWCLRLKAVPDSSGNVDAGPSALPKAFAFAPVAPNPVRGGRTMLHFALPYASDASLAIYDVSGRLVRSVVKGSLEAGNHDVLWDGRDESGTLVRPGLYLASFRAGSFSAARRMVVVK